MHHFLRACTFLREGEIVEVCADQTWLYWCFFLTLRNISFETWCILLFLEYILVRKKSKTIFFAEWSQNWKGRRGIAIWGNYCQHFAKIDFISNTWNVILYSSMKKRLLAMWVRSNKDGAFIEGNQSKNLKYITQKNNYTNLSLLPFYSL